MKRAKFALTAVAVLAVIGGALAFKASRTGSFLYTETTTKNAQGQTITVCNVGTVTPYITVSAGGQFIKASTAATSVPCPDLRVVPNL